MNRKKLTDAALMKEAPDLVLKNARVVNVFTGEIVPGDIAVTDGIIVGVGEYSGKTERDLEGRYVCPGFVNAHLHVESSMVTPEEYAFEELRWGTTTLITDPHEFAMKLRAGKQAQQHKGCRQQQANAQQGGTKSFFHRFLLNKDRVMRR